MMPALPLLVDLLHIFSDLLPLDPQPRSGAPPLMLPVEPSVAFEPLLSVSVAQSEREFIYTSLLLRFSSRDSFVSPPVF